MNILIADKFEQSGIDGIKALGATVSYEPAAGAEGLAAAIAKSKPDLLIVRSSKVPAAVLQSAAGLKAIIRVANCPGMNSIAVAELAMGLLLACDRRIPDQTAEIKSGKWNKKEFSTKARGLKGSTLGIIGLGAIGQAVAKRAQAFEMNVVGWDKFMTAQQVQPLGIRFAGTDRAALLRMVGECNAITVHVALVPETKAMCNAEFFAAMKTGSIFINTSRGGIVDEAALRDAVKAKGLRVGLDVYGDQPGTPQADFATPTAALTGAAFTHHCGASTDQAQSAVGDETVRLVRVFKETGRLENCVNPK